MSIVALAESKSVDVNIIQDSSHWEKLANFTVANSDTVVSKYKSSLTGNILTSVWSAISIKHKHIAVYRTNSCCCPG